EGGETVLAPIAGGDFAAEQVRHQLLAVADAEHRYAEREDRGIDGRALGVVDAARTAGDNDAAHAGELGRRCFTGAHLGVVAELAGDQMTILAARVEYDDLR